MQLDDELFVSKPAPSQRMVVQNIGDESPLVTENTVVPIHERAFCLIEIFVDPRVNLLVVAEVKQVTIQLACW